MRDQAQFNERSGAVWSVRYADADLPLFCDARASLVRMTCGRVPPSGHSQDVCTYLHNPAAVVEEGKVGDDAGGYVDKVRGNTTL